MHLSPANNVTPCLPEFPFRENAKVGTYVHPAALWSNAIQTYFLPLTSLLFSFSSLLLQPSWLLEGVVRSRLSNSGKDWHYGQRWRLRNAVFSKLKVLANLLLLPTILSSIVMVKKSFVCEVVLSISESDQYWIVAWIPGVLWSDKEVLPGVKAVLGVLRKLVGSVSMIINHGVLFTDRVILPL